LVAVAPGCGDPDGGLPNAGNVSWERQESGLRSTLVAVGQGVGIKSTDVFAESEGTGADAAILKYEGGAWTPARPGMAMCLTCKTPRTAVTGSQIINAAVGGAVARWDNAKMDWITEKTGLPSDILALWAADPTHVFAVSDRGAIALFDGATWRLMESP